MKKNSTRRGLLFALGAMVALLVALVVITLRFSPEGQPAAPGPLPVPGHTQATLTSL